MKNEGHHLLAVISGYLETMVCQSTVIIWPLFCTLYCLRPTIFQIYSFSSVILPASFIHKWCQGSEQVSPNKYVCQRSPAVNCTHSHHNTFEFSEGCCLLIDHSVDSSFLICVVPTHAESFSSPTPLSIDPCNKPNNVVFPFMYFISDLFMSKSSIDWIVCVKSSPVASRIWANWYYFVETWLFFLSKHQTWKTFLLVILIYFPVLAYSSSAVITEERKLFVQQRIHTHTHVKTRNQVHTCILFWTLPLNMAALFTDIV